MGLDNPLHIAFLVVVLLLLFGAKRLPEIGRSLGSGMREFKDSISGDSNRPGLNAATEQPPQDTAAPAPAPTAAPVPAPTTSATPPPAAPAPLAPPAEHQPEPQHQG
jgi:sec-independent protein translocase protein TatA